MKLNHIITVLSAAGILLPTCPVAAVSVPLPAIGAAVNPATKKKKKVKKGKKKSNKKKAKNSVKTLANQIFNPTEEQKQKAKAYLESNKDLCIEDAMEKDNDQAVYAFLTTRPDKRQSDFETACFLGKAKYAKLLLEAPNIDINREDKRITGRTSGKFLNNFETPLSQAVGDGHFDIVKLLLAAPGIDVSSSLLPYRALSNFDKEIVQLLVSDSRVKIVPHPELFMAIFKGDTAAVKHIINQQGTDVNAIDPQFSHTPLMYAAGLGHHDIVKLLIDHPNTDINKKGGDGKSAISYAAETGRTEVLKLLLKVPGIEINDDVKIRCKAGQEGHPLRLAVLYGHADAVQLLIEELGIDVSSTEALHLAAREGRTDVVKLLLNVPGIDVNKATDDGSTPLHFAACSFTPECVELLLAVPGIDINKVNDYAQAPLNEAMQSKYSYKGTQLEEFVQRKSAKCIELLKAAGAI